MKAYVIQGKWPGGDWGAVGPLVLDKARAVQVYERIVLPIPGLGRVDEYEYRLLELDFPERVLETTEG